MTALRLKVRPSRPAGDAKGFVVRNPAFAQVLGDAPRLERLTTVRADANAANGMTAVALGEIRLAGAVNFTFGGPRRDALFITTDDAIWAAVLHTTGS
jgi:hypothetical protein